MKLKEFITGLLDREEEIGGTTGRVVAAANALIQKHALPIPMYSKRMVGDALYFVMRFYYKHLSEDTFTGNIGDVPLVVRSMRVIDTDYKIVSFSVLVDNKLYWVMVHVEEKEHKLRLVCPAMAPIIRDDGTDTTADDYTVVAKQIIDLLQDEKVGLNLYMEARDLLKQVLGIVADIESERAKEEEEEFSRICR